MQTILALLLCILAQALAKNQCMSVRGHVKCPSRPDQHYLVRVLFYDEDPAGNSDDVMDTAFTSYNGYFQAYGCASDPLGGTIDPRIMIYHKCKVDEKAVKIEIPKNAVATGEYNITQLINLENPSSTGISHITEQASHGDVHPTCLPTDIPPTRATNQRQRQRGSHNLRRRREQMESNDNDEMLF